MILRKPYAFLIKHFKLIHLIITFFMALSFFKTFDILSFFGDYVINESSVIGQQLSDVVYPSIVFIAPIVVIIFSLILLGVMLAKKKPYVLYITNIVVYLAILVVSIIGYNTVVQLQKVLVDLRIIKLIRDFTTILLIIEIYPLCKNLVRGIGFDVKQFDFKKDLAELEIEETDNEEFEVSVSLDINKAKRLKNTGLRNFKYFYLEHKLIVNISAVVIVLLVAGLTFLGITKTNTTIYYNSPVRMNNLTIKTLRTYATRLDYSGNVINNLGKNNTLIVIPIEIKNSTNTKKELVTANIELRVDGKKYHHISTYRDPIYDLGETYQQDEIDKETTKRVNLVYEIPTKSLDKQMTLKYITSIDNSTNQLIPTYSNLKLKIDNLDINQSTEEIVLNDNLSLNKSIFGESTMLIKNVEISKRFKIDYSICLSSSNCLKSYEYLNAPLVSNKDNALMKINSELTIDESYKLSSVTYPYDFLNTFGSIKYTIGEKTSLIKSFTKVNPLATKSNNIFFVSVPMELLEADSIELIYTLRNKQYKYIVK